MAAKGGLIAGTAIPEIALPEDLGDGPFAGPLPGGDFDHPAQADSEVVFQRDRPFEETLLTDNWLMGPSELIAMGNIHVNDTVPAGSFRRVQQHISMGYSSSIEGFPIIVFRGNPMAVINEGISNLAPTPTTGAQLSRNTQPAGRPEPAPSPGSDTPTSLEKGMDALATVQELVRPTMSLQTSSFFITFRLPGYEPGIWGRTVAPQEMMTFDPSIVRPIPLQRANRTEEFFFGNSGGFQKVFPIDYPVGNSIPVIFDIANPNPVMAVSVAISVAVYMYRGETDLGAG